MKKLLYLIFATLLLKSALGCPPLFWKIIMNESGQLVLRRATLSDVTIEPDGLNQFHYISEKGLGQAFDQWLLFKKDAKGNITGITVWSERVMHHEFDKVSN
jgi:hypothetical protein